MRRRSSVSWDLRPDATPFTGGFASAGLGVDGCGGLDTESAPVEAASEESEEKIEVDCRGPVLCPETFPSATSMAKARHQRLPHIALQVLEQNCLEPM
mmetsp:Transcript_37887/g.70174  ORF Transcript_37887/g.70174 Transcript_37887/m.70174 type:complete len:98 (-) Transcript_37887:5-298(-)